MSQSLIQLKVKTMTFDEAYKHCIPHPNGTYDLIPFVNAEKREVVFKWGNSLLLAFDQESHDMAKIVDKTFENVHPERIRDLLLLDTVRLSKVSKGENK